MAKVNLERQGYRVYFPQLQQRGLRRGRWVERISALFPRYLFLEIDPDRQTLAPIRSTLGVTDVVRFGVEYAVVPAHIVEGLMLRADSETGLHALRCPLFGQGMAVRVVTGALTGLEGIFEREVGGDRVVVLFTLLGREARVRMPLGSIVPDCAA
jgi:transcriptional antiterminator RfaH